MNDPDQGCRHLAKPIGILPSARLTLRDKLIQQAAERAQMTETGDLDAVWTETDTEGLFTSIGKYVIIFQWIEGVLDEILLLAWGHEKQSKLAKMTNEAKVDTVKRLVFASSDFARVHTRPEWCSHLAVVCWLVGRACR